MFKSMAPTALHPTRGRVIRAAFSYAWEFEVRWKSIMGKKMADILGLEMQILKCSVVKSKTK